MFEVIVNSLVKFKRFFASGTRLIDFVGKVPFVLFRVAFTSKFDMRSQFLLHADSLVESDILIFDRYQITFQIIMINFEDGLVSFNIFYVFFQLSNLFSQLFD
jgi:hypothetical protein